MKKQLKGKSPITYFLDENAINNIIENPEGISSPWYGQLMRAPQILAYLLQIDFWMQYYNVEIEGV